MKQQNKSYRTIRGIRFTQLTDDESLFDDIKRDIKKLGLKFKIDKKIGRIWIEQKIF